MNVQLSLTNSLSLKNEICHFPFDKKLSLYVCGITPYDYAHLGHGRCYVTFDVLLRLMKFLGFSISYCRNITDIDDKLITRAEKELGSGERFKEIADTYYSFFKKNMRDLGCIDPNQEPRVTEVIQEIIDFITILIDKKYAYVIDSDVYFDVSRYPSYGQLGHRELIEQQAGARVSINEKKKSPLDFALWKGSTEKPFWNSPWGTGRPGWHIECSVMSKLCCGNTISIHGGGMDLIFPHHENERAQSECCNNERFVEHWVHCAFVRVNAEKMSKSLNNFITLNDVFEQYNPMVLRYFYSSHHYRSPLDFTWEALEVAQKTYKRLLKIFENSDNKKYSENDLDEKGYEIYTKALSHLCNDMNTPGFLGVIFEYSSHITTDHALKYLLSNLLKNILGLDCIMLEEKEINFSDEILELLKERDTARAQKNFKRADEIRALLISKGISLNDQKL